MTEIQPIPPGIGDILAGPEAWYAWALIMPAPEAVTVPTARVRRPRRGGRKLARFGAPSGRYGPPEHRVQ